MLCNGHLILHGKFNMIGGGVFKNFPRQLPKCKGVSKFLTKIVVLIQPEASAPWGPKCSPRPMAHSLFKSRQISINPRTEVEYQRTRFWLPVYTHVQYTQTESNRPKAKTIRVSSRIKDFRLTGSPFSGTRLTGSQVANKCAGR